MAAMNNVVVRMTPSSFTSNARKIPDRYTTSFVWVCTHAPRTSRGVVSSAAPLRRGSHGLRAVVMQRPIAALPGAVLLIVLMGAAAHAAGTIDVYEAAGHGREPTPAVSAMEPRVVGLDTDNTRHPAHYLKVSASDDGSFAVFNSRTNETKRYPARR